VGGGCGCLIFACVTVLVIGVLGVVLNQVKQSDLYQGALSLARNNEQVVQALGEPIEPGWWVTGSMETSGPTGSADFAFPLSGPRNRGTLYVVATRSAGLWEFQRIELGVADQNERIPLLTGR
jgi:hypothetical protein